MRRSTRWCGEAPSGPPPGLAASLAAEIAALVHGAEETRRAIAASQALFGQGELKDVDQRTLFSAAASCTSFNGQYSRKYRAIVGPGATVVGLPPVANLMAAAGTVPTVSAGRRAIAEGRAS